MNYSDILLAQLNPVVGDIQGNAANILAAYQHASATGAKMVVCPELALTGYPPEDLLLSPAFRKQAMEAARRLAEATGACGLVFGSPWEENAALYNSALFAADGQIRHIHHKIALPNYGVFDEKRYFTAGHHAKTVEWRGQHLLFMVCEDIWHFQQPEELTRQKADLVVVINASPFERGKLALRKKIVARAAECLHTPVVYVNMVGGQDDIVFDGGSFVADAHGYVVAQAPECEKGTYAASIQGATLSEEESVWKALCLGLSDYTRKNGFSGVVLGLSGGIDSAISAAIAVDALGAGNVRGVLLPSPYTSAESNEDALETARLLGIRTDTIPITPAMEVMEKSLSPLMSNVMEDVAVGGNIQARIRGQILMAISNKTGLMLLSTGNKSEIAVGYSTLYGDACGGYNCLKDVYKTEVYQLANWRNGKSAVIPRRSISKAPSAELKPNQKDSDQLPEYDVLDQILCLHIEGRLSEAEITPRGYDGDIVKRVLALVRRNEYKRRQSAPGVKVSPMLFGKDRRFPLTNGFTS